MKEVLQLKGLDCANCALELEEEIEKISGVVSCTVAFANQKLTVEFDTKETLEKVKYVANHFEEVSVVESKENGTKKADDKIVLKLENLHCAACALDLEDEIRKIKEVKEVHVDYPSQSIFLETDSDVGIKKAIAKANKFEKVRVLNEDEYTFEETESKWKEAVPIIISSVLFILALILGKVAGNVGRYISYGLFAVAYLVVGFPVLVSTAKNIVKGKVFDENFLMTIASLGAVAMGQYAEGVAVMLLYELGEFLQGVAVGSSRKSISSLMELKSESATKITEDGQIVVKPEELEVGDRVIIHAGERIPVDGIVVSESATLDTKSLTGEAEPRTYKKGEELLAGCINLGGVFEMQVERLYENSAVKKILDMVENSTAKKAASEKFITKFARIYTPIVCCLAAVIAFLLPLMEMWIRGGTYYEYFSLRAITALEFLVVSCPCALIISVPLTYFSGIGSCAKAGILVKGATYLDTAANVNAIAFDKTGTLTEGNFKILSVNPNKDITKQELLEIVASVESFSSHPIAKAFEKADFSGGKIEEIAGRGIRAEKDGDVFLVGNAELLIENKIDFKEMDSVYTLIYAAKNDQFLGVIEVGDGLKKEAKDAILALNKLGVTKTVMLTGDKKLRAEAVAKEAGISEVCAELLPEDKLNKAQIIKENGVLMYVGDGINDAPVMAEADVAVSMGKLGSGAAVEASDFVLVSDDLKAVPKSIKIAKKTKRIVKQNIIFSLLMKLVFMVLSFMGLPIWLAVFGDVGVMLIAVLNSFRMRMGVKV